MEKTKIDWCDSTWNPVTGCLHGCEYCYARGQAPYFMPEEAARIFIQVLDVQAQHLQGMTLDDFYEEGVVGSEAYNEPENAYRQAQRIFAEKIWNKTLKKKADRELYSWDANPWVWAIGFKRVYPDDMEG